MVEKCGAVFSLDHSKVCKRTFQHYGLHRDRATMPRKWADLQQLKTWGDNESVSTTRKGA